MLKAPRPATELEVGNHRRHNPARCVVVQSVHLCPVQRGLTLRSSGAPTAGRQARSGGTRYIVASPGLAACRRRPLNSNVRRCRLVAFLVSSSTTLARGSCSWVSSARAVSRDAVAPSGSRAVHRRFRALCTLVPTLQQASRLGCRRGQAHQPPPHFLPVKRECPRRGRCSG